MFIASFTKNYFVFVIFYGGFSGIGCGINYVTPLVCAWEYYPKRKGLISGIIIGAYGIGSFAYSLIAKALVNPQNFKATKDVGIKDMLLFDERVALNVPSMLRWLVFIYLV